MIYTPEESELTLNGRLDLLGDLRTGHNESASREDNTGSFLSCLLAVPESFGVKDLFLWPWPTTEGTGSSPALFLLKLSRFLLGRFADCALKFEDSWPSDFDLLSSGNSDVAECSVSCDSFLGLHKWDTGCLKMSATLAFLGDILKHR